MPHFTKRAKLDIPAAVLMELVQNPDYYKNMIDELEKRKTEAEEKEAKAVTATRKLGAAERLFNTKKEEFAQSRKREEAQITKTRDSLQAEETRMAGVASELHAWDDRLQAQAKRDEQSASERAAHAGRLAAQGDELRVKETDLLTQEADLQEREDSLADRQAKFKNRIRALNEDLD